MLEYVLYTANIILELSFANRVPSYFCVTTKIEQFVKFRDRVHNPHICLIQN